MKFIFYISLSDFFVDISSAFGFPSNYSLCYTQALFVTYFTVSGWLWTTALSHTIYQVIYNKRTIQDKYFHFICWGLPVFTTFGQLPFGQYTYPYPKDQWCNYKLNSNITGWKGDLIEYTFYWNYFFVTIALMLFWGVRVYWKIYHTKDMENSRIILNMYQKVRLYPVIIGCCWLINYLVTEFSSDQSSLVAFIGMLAGTLDGFFTAMIFFVNSEEARGRWKDLIFPHLRSMSVVTAIPIDFEDDVVYETSSERTTSADRTHSKHIESIDSVMHMTSLNSDL